MRLALPLLAFALISCSNLAGQLIGAPRSFTYTPAYVADGKQHTLTAIFTVENGIVTALAIEPGATGGERAKQLVFAANVRPYILGKDVAAIALPAAIGEEGQLTEIFQGVLRQLRQEVL